MYGMVWTCRRVSVELKQIKNPDDEIKFIVGIILALKQPIKAYRRISFFAPATGSPETKLYATVPPQSASPFSALL